jgi:hypothetical protein
LNFYGCSAFSTPLVTARKTLRMLRNASQINGYAIAASDGRLGTVADFLFDDVSWSVRWLVVDTGKWLSGRKVLLPPAVFGRPDPDDGEFAVGLTMQQVKDSPDIGSARPVSRQIETNIYDYYGWQPYWGTDLLMGGFAGRREGALGFTGAGIQVAGGGYRGRSAQQGRSASAQLRSDSPATISTPATAKSVTSRIFFSKRPIGKSAIWSSIRRTGGRGNEF